MSINNDTKGSDKEKSLSKNAIMDGLLDDIKKYSFPKVGDLIDGKIIFVGRNEILVDIDGMMTGLIRGHESYDESGEYTNLKVGDIVTSTVLEIENEKGLLELSLRQAGHKKAWDYLRELKDSNKIVEVTALEANKGGLIVKLDKIFGFLPVSQLSPQNYPRVLGGNKSKILEKLKPLVGKKISVMVININDEEGTLIVSEKEVEKEKIKASIDKYKKGDIIEGVVTGVVNFGAFVEFDKGLEGLVHISELGWHRIDDPRDVVTEGQKVKTQIIDISKDKISLSLKRLASDPWEKISDKYKVGDKVEGKVIKLNDFGAFVEIESQIQGLARNIANKKINADKDDSGIKIGERYQFVVNNFDAFGHKLGLTLSR